MFLGRSQVIPPKRFHAEDVVGDRMIGPQLKRGFRLTNDVGAAPLLLRLYRECQMLFGRHPHEWK